MIWERENRTGAWIGLVQECISFDEDVLEEMLKRRNGILILDGVSGCGKTRLLHRFRERSENPVAIHSYREITEELVNLCRKMDGQTVAKMRSLLSAQPILAVEDLDYLRGLETTQEMLGMIFGGVAKQSLIILTGNDLEESVPKMLRCLEHSKRLKFLHSGSAEDEMLAIGSIFPEGGMDRDLLNQVLTERHKRAMYSLVRTGILEEGLTRRISPLEKYRGMHQNCPKACEDFLEMMWSWQERNGDRNAFLQIRDCFCKAAEVLEDRDGTIAFRAAELLKASGEVERAIELYSQILPRVLRSGDHTGMAITRGYYWAGAVRGYRSMRSPERDEETMRDALWMFGQAMQSRRDDDDAVDPSRITILWAMVNSHAYLGELQQAEQYCLEILRIQESLPEAHPDRIETCIQFSQLCREYGKRADCQTWLLKAAELLERTPASEELGWMYGLVACNCWKLSDEKRLEFYQKERTNSFRRFQRDPRKECQWHRQVSQLCARMGDIPEALYHKERELEIGKAYLSEEESRKRFEELKMLLGQISSEQ